MEQFTFILESNGVRIQQNAETGTYLAEQLDGGDLYVESVKAELKRIGQTRFMREVKWERSQYLKNVCVGRKVCRDCKENEPIENGLCQACMSYR